MKRLTNKALVAFLLLSVASSVFGGPEAKEYTMKPSEACAIYYADGCFGMADAKIVQELIETGEMAEYGLVRSVLGFYDGFYAKANDTSKIITMLTEAGLYEPAFASAFGGIAEAAELQFNFGIDTGLKGIAAAAESQFNAGIHKGFSSIAALAEKLSTSTLCERLAMKVGLVNKAKEIVYTAANTTVGQFIRDYPMFTFVAGTLATSIGLIAAYELYAKSGEKKE